MFLVFMAHVRLEKQNFLQAFFLTLSCGILLLLLHRCCHWHALHNTHYLNCNYLFLCGLCVALRRSLRMACLLMGDGC
jgi:hypothetical protein